MPGVLFSLGVLALAVIAWRASDRLRAEALEIAARTTAAIEQRAALDREEARRPSRCELGVPLVLPDPDGLRCAIVWIEADDAMTAWALAEDLQTRWVLGLGQGGES